MSTDKRPWQSRWAAAKGWMQAIAVVGGLAVLVLGGIGYGCAREYMEWKTMRAIQHGSRP